jgi:carboxypeptidase Q
MTRIRPALLALAAAGVLTLAASRPASPATPRTPANAPAYGAGGDDAVDLGIITRIRNEGFHHSQVMATIAHLTDSIGPRLTGTPELKEANEWTRQQLAGWGLANAHLEGWEFGRGWSFSRAVVAMVEPRQTQLAALPKAWTPGTQGEVRGEAVRVAIDTLADMEKYRGKLAGKIALLDKEQDVSAATAEATERPRRLTPDKLDDLAEYKLDGGPSAADRLARRERFQVRTAVRKFLVDEKALASIEASPLPWGVIRVQGGGPYKDGDPPAVTGLVMAAEPYNRLVRLLNGGQKIELSIDVKTREYDGDKMAYNTVAEIPGSDPRGEVVMIGAHLDSWHAGTGATDNAAGCAVAMEAVRILSALHLKPRRTVRIALWTGEEEGLLGSEAYVSEHFASWPKPPAGAMPNFAPGSEPDGPLTVKPAWSKLAAYFNLDNGSGKIRGITVQENAAVEPIFNAWLAPFADLGATAVSMRSVGSTDHISFDRVGLPGFQFIQDELDYMNHTHHTNADVYDHLEASDLMQASVILASFAYDAASRAEMLPRKPLPASATAPAKPAAPPAAKATATAPAPDKPPAVPVPAKPPVGAPGQSPVGAAPGE